MKIEESIDHALEQGHDIVVGTYIGFSRILRYETGKKTQVWLVSAGAIQLGWVKWFGQWRGYAFFPSAETMYEQVCLRQIAFFCEKLTKLHRKSKEKTGIVSQVEPPQ